MTSTAPQNASDTTMNSSDIKTEPVDTPSSGFTGIPGLTLTQNSTIISQPSTNFTQETQNEAHDKPAQQESSVVVNDSDNRRSDHERKASESVTVPKPEWQEPKDGPGQYYFLDSKRKSFLPKLVKANNFLSSIVAVERPHVSAHDDLIAGFHLADIANSVRRTDPVTGEKINKLRKSYEGKIKTLGIAGKNKATIVEGEFFPRITDIPEEEWHVQYAQGHDIETVRDPPAFQEKLDRALAIQPGPLAPQIESKFKSIIANDDGPRKGPAELSRKPPAVQPSLPMALQRPAVLTSPSLKPLRPERTGTKRRYNDASFAGYTDTFDNEELDSEGDALAGRLKKKQRKV